ncbi:tRNA nucleotidyltransferase (CCA-adding enzyme) [Eoetvoesiella caeni]|uniref:tRNA nucleotidyltransferase (CCA-adding enzyme) n=1 Tax=Eoetvoesiella caeni TaxID=645616 RepID=A0A366H2M6_9BURK|nr:tRNA nucleotidyltransferase (CCA-adding enzyme) [Eoetvoesiella caeni]
MAIVPSDGDAATQGLDVYVVGGAVRDALLGLPAGDRDWVVVGATPESMSKRGFIPVGGDFPVFLHPQTKEEYALARTERKSGRGYQGFTFYTGVDVTLEEDLKRRDLTVNAIARAPDGRLIDPLGGQADVKAKVLRHVGDAFVEDPVRLLRLARFAARFHDFSVAPETMELARRLVEDGEVDALVPERVWREVTKGLDAAQPGRMFEVLQKAGALERVMPGLVFNDEIAQQLACGVRCGLSLAGRFALLCRLSTQPEDVGRRVRASSECIDYARLLPQVVAALPAAEVQSADSGAAPAGAAAQLDLIERCDGLRKPDRYMDLLRTAACVGQLDTELWRTRLDAVRSVDAGAIAKAQQGRPEQIKAALKEARLRALSSLA